MTDRGPSPRTRFPIAGVEQEGEAGINHFKQHPAVNLQQVNYTINLDTVTVANENPNGLHLVKRSIELIKN